MPSIILKWKYANGSEYEHPCIDAYMAGTLYFIKAHESGIVEVSIYSDDCLVVRSTNVKGDEE